MWWMYDWMGWLMWKLICKGMCGVVLEMFIDWEYVYSGQDELLKKWYSWQGVMDYFYDMMGCIMVCWNEVYLDSWQYDVVVNLLDRWQGEIVQVGVGSVVLFNWIMLYCGLYYCYDEYGWVVEKWGCNGMQYYCWDVEYWLMEVVVIWGSIVWCYGYVYDVLGRWVEKYELDVEGKLYNWMMFLWDGMWLVQECRLGRSSSLYIYSDQGSYELLVWVDRVVLGEVDEVLYYYMDVNGVLEEMMDGGGNIVWEVGYQVWGNLMYEKEVWFVQQNLCFQG